MKFPTFAASFLALAAYAAEPVPVFQGSIERLDPALDALAGT
jgi:hypothetical protein